MKMHSYEACHSICALRIGRAAKSEGLPSVLPAASREWSTRPSGVVTDLPTTVAPVRVRAFGMPNIC